MLLFMPIPKTSIASGKDESILKAPANIFVITGEEMQQRGYLTVRDLVEDLPGVYLHHGIGYSKDGYAIIRGVAGTQRFKVMING